MNSSANEENELPKEEETQAPSTEPAAGPIRLDASAGYLAGKTFEEAGQYVNDIVRQAADLSTRAQAVVAQRSQPTPEPTPVISGDDFLNDPNAAFNNFQREMDQRVEARVASIAQPMVQSQIDNARFMSQSDPKNAEIYEKYGSQIEARMASVIRQAPGLAISKQHWDTQVRLIASEHMDEIIQDRTDKLLTQRLGERSSQHESIYDTPVEGEAGIWERIENTPLGKQTIKLTGKRGIIEMLRAHDNTYGGSLEKYAASLERSSKGARVGTDGDDSLTIHSGR